MAWLRFLWRVTSGYRLRPWRSPLLAWRIETYSGLPAERIGFRDFWSFCWRERGELSHFLVWTQQMSLHRRHDRHPPQSAQSGPD
ncbi:MAG: hypothetical protein ACRD1Y_13870 [Terriglobales bacterium]